MAAYFWETPPVSSGCFDRDFEYVLIDAPSLVAEQADPSPFAGFFDETAGDAVRFRNLGRDAVLVTPVPAHGDDNYAHLASFLRAAPQRQIDALWRLTFEALTRMLTNSPIWVSTSGLGVAWVHVRLDSTPKYYNHLAYRKWG